MEYLQQGTAAYRKVNIPLIAGSLVGKGSQVLSIVENKKRLPFALLVEDVNS